MTIYKYTIINEDDIFKISMTLEMYDVLFDNELISNDSSDIELEEYLNDNNIKYIKTEIQI